MLPKIVPASRFSPTHVQIEITWRCNWRCVHCYQDRHDIEVLTTSNLLSLFDSLAEAGTMHVILTGGEPTVRRDIFILLESLAKKKILVTLYSNGHRINQSMADRLSSLVGAVELSLLAGTATTHDALSGVPGSHARVVSAARALRQSGIAVVLKTPVMHQAIETLKEIELLAMEIGAEWNADTEISKSYEGAKFPLDNALDADQLKKFYKDFPQFNPANGIRGLDPGVIGGMCLAGRQYCFIDVYGNVYPCLNFKASSDKIENSEIPNPRMGNVLEETFSDIWGRSKSAQLIRTASREQFSRCSDCKRACTPCMALNYEETGNYFLPAPSVCTKTRIGSII